MQKTKYIVIDAEYTDKSRELLELSICDIHGNTLFHSYFKPRRAKEWLLVPHNITPEMVTDSPAFKEVLPDVRKIVNGCSHIVGFATDNDINILVRHGVHRARWRHVADVRLLYWLCRGRNEGIGIYDTPGLAKCLAAFGLEFGEGGEHSASGDAQATAWLMLKLFKEFDTLYPDKAHDSLSAKWRYVNSLIDEEKERLRTERAARHREKERLREKEKRRTRKRRRKRRRGSAPAADAAPAGE